MFILNGVLPIYGVAYATPIAEVISFVTAVILTVVFFKRLFAQSKLSASAETARTPKL